MTSRECAVLLSNFGDKITRAHLVLRVGFRSKIPKISAHEEDKIGKLVLKPKGMSKF